jgi:hypothetical protein
LVPSSGGGGDNTAPSVTINSPADGANFDSGTLISFSGSASDAEDGDLTSDLVWASNLDGQIGTGGSFDAVLSSGTHTVTASVTDKGGLSDSASVTITVVVTQPTPPPSGTITVASLVGSSSTVNKNFWNATVTTTIKPGLSGALITGTWGDGKPYSCTTDSSGQCSSSTNVRTKDYTAITLMINDVVLSGYEYVPGDDSVTVDQP